MSTFSTFKDSEDAYAKKLGEVFREDLLVRGEATRVVINRWNLKKFLTDLSVLCLTTDSGRGLVFIQLNLQAAQEAMTALEAGETLNLAQILRFDDKKSSSSDRRYHMSFKSEDTEVNEYEVAILNTGGGSEDEN